jgi:uncharacterized membrane protein YeaQ/YmgE (transglycosylase-associated protein family)
MRDPMVSFLLILVIGAVAGLLFDRLLGPGWLSRQFAGTSRLMVTSALVGIAGAFIGFHLTVLLGIVGGGGAAPLIGAVIGALAVLWLWRMVR